MTNLKTQNQLRFLNLIFVISLIALIGYLSYIGSQNKDQQKLLKGAMKAQGFVKSTFDCYPNFRLAKLKAYVINGIKYHPFIPNVGEVHTGVASWYGSDFHGKLTASGGVYDMNKVSAAHKEFPMGTVLKVVNLDNNKEVIVVVNDRGPFVGTRMIDLSYAAAQKIESVGNGLANVSIEVLGFNKKIS